MAHFAELDENDVVLRVVLVPEAQEARGEAFLRDDLGLGGRWLQTSYNGTFRKNFAGPGCKYDTGRDAFVPPKPYVSWVLNEETCQWDPPMPFPVAEGTWLWNEETLGWDQMEP